MSQSKYHHFVPQFLLKNFRDGRIVWIGDKAQGKHYPSSPRKALREGDLYANYSLKNINNKQDINEKLLAQIEGYSAPVISKVIERVRDGQPPCLLPNEREVMKCNLFAMHRRSPETIAELKFDEQINDILISILKSQFDSFDTSKLQDIFSKQSLEVSVLIQNCKAKFASGYHHILQQDVSQFSAETGLMIAFICNPKKSFVIGSCGATKVEGGPATGSWFPISYDVAVCLTSHPDREVLWNLQGDQQYIVRQINLATVKQSHFIASRSEVLIKSLLNL